MILLVAMIAVFYFLIIRPENKRKKQAENMRNSLKKGERITTIGGMVGRIVQVNDTTVVFETSEDRVRIEVAKWGIQSTESMEAAAAQKGKKSSFVKKDEKKEEHYLRREFSYSSYSQSYALPEDADQEKISAEVSDGVLKIEIPKTAKEEKKDDVKHIEVK